MRWRYRKAPIDEALRTTFEQHGVGTMQALLASAASHAASSFVHRGVPTAVDADVRVQLLRWLTEQYQRAETWETWSMTMEVSITVLVAVELLLMLQHPGLY